MTIVLLDRLTDHFHVVEAGSESWRDRHSSAAAQARIQCRERSKRAPAREEAEWFQVAAMTSSDRPGSNLSRYTWPVLNPRREDMANIQLSCGLLVINERNELLVGHSTGSRHWDLPKGLIDAGETPIVCALREAHEEFGLTYSDDRLIDLGRHAYYRGKDLHLFAVGTTLCETVVERCTCSSYFELRPGARPVPEIDRFAWAHDKQLRAMLAKNMRRLLLEEGLLTLARARRSNTDAAS